MSQFRLWYFPDSSFCDDTFYCIVVRGDNKNIIYHVTFWLNYMWYVSCWRESESKKVLGEKNAWTLIIKHWGFNNLQSTKMLHLIFLESTKFSFPRKLKSRDKVLTTKVFFFHVIQVRNEDCSAGNFSAKFQLRWDETSLSSW